MTECWSPGDLRAAIDRELPAETLERIVAHLQECGECRAVHAELDARARRVGLAMADLSAVGRVLEPVKITDRRGTGHRILWPVMALAAGLAIGWLVVPKKSSEPPVPKSATVTLPPKPETQPETQIAQTVRPTPPRPKSRRVKPAAPARPQTLDFVALDDRPIDNGVVMRVSWGPENLQADIIFGPDGSARAYRLVNANYRH
jgi:anti-sigma factor RsiW